MTIDDYISVDDDDDDDDVIEAHSLFFILCNTTGDAMITLVLSKRLVTCKIVGC